MEFSKYFETHYDIKLNDDKINKAIDEIENYVYNKLPIYIIGNGGSAYTGSHFAQDLTKSCNGNAVSLSENIGIILAISNDINFDDIFSFQLEHKKDNFLLLIAISCSGKSPNIIKAVKYAQKNYITTIGFTGFGGGELGKLCNIEINVPDGNMFRIESWHSLICHYIVDEIIKRQDLT